MCHIYDNTFLFSQKQRIKLNNELNIEGIIEQAINQLYNNRKVNKKTRNQLINSHYQPLKKAVEEGYGKPLMKIEYNTPSYNFLKELQTNTAVFAAFKNHACLKEMVAMLKDHEGNVKPRDQFIKEALKINANYRITRLEAEYDTAVRSARMAAQWQQFQKNKHLYPNLRYMPTKAANPDPIHATYVGIVRPIDDIFWQTHYPPNRWRCQCSVEQTDDEATDIPNDLKPIPKEWAFNCGNLAQIFDLKNSNYIQTVPSKEQPALIKAAKKIINTDAASNAPYINIYTSKSGSKVEVHPLTLDNNDYEVNVKKARELANSSLPFKNIQVLPDLKKYPELREKLLPDAKGMSNPDFRIDNHIFDAKDPSGKQAGKNTIKNRISDAHKQGDGAIITIPDNYISMERLFEDIYAKFQHDAYKNFKIVLHITNKWTMYTRDSFLVEYFKRKKQQ